MTKYSYNPPPSLQGFITSQKLVSLVVDPTGRDLVACGMVKIIHHTEQMAPNRDGIRRSETVWVSDTAARKAASVQEFSNLFPNKTSDPMGIDDDTYGLRFSDIECRILFRVYHGAVEVSDLPKSSFYVFDEFNNIDESLLECGPACTGRYPSKRDNGVGCVTDSGANNGLVWGMSQTMPSSESYWDKFINDHPGKAYINSLP